MSYLKLENINKTYTQGDFKALSSINLTINKGEMIGLTGPSGSGKTTLLNILGLIDRPDADGGKLILGDRELQSLTFEEHTLIRRNEIGFIFQHFNLIPVMSVLENVEYPLILLNESDKKRRSKALEILDMVGIADLAKKYPDQISGGQKQRTAIARSLIKKPKLIIADEPTASLDKENSLNFFQILRNTIATSEHKPTFIMASHDPLALEQCTRVITLVNGEITKEEIQNVI